MSAHKKIDWLRLRWAVKEAVFDMVALIINMVLMMLPVVLTILTGTFWFLLLYPIIIFVLTVWDSYSGF